MQKEHNRQVSVALYDAVDAVRGTYTDKTSQDQFLDDLAKQKDLTIYRNKQWQLHNASTLRKHMSTRLTSAALKDPKAKSDFFQDGTSMLTDEHLAQIRQSAPPATSLRSESKNVQTALTKSKRKRAPSEDEWQGSPESPEPSKKVRKTRETDRPNSVIVLDDSSSERTEKPAREIANSSDSHDAPHGDGVVGGLMGEPGGKTTIRFNIPQASTPKATEEVESYFTPGQTAVPNTEPVQETQTTEQVQEAPVKSVETNVAEEHQQRHQSASPTDMSNDRSHTSSPDVSPPKIPLPRWDQMHGARKAYNQVEVNIQRDMSSLQYMASNFPTNFCIPNELDALKPATLVQHPPKDLEALYAKIFATEDWHSAFNKRLNQQKPWPLTVNWVLTSLIAAAVYEKVFSVKQPWDVEQNIKTAMCDVYGDKVLEKLGYTLPHFWQLCAWEQVSDPEFKPNVERHAKKLSAELAETLAPHLLLIRETQRPEGEYPRFGLGLGDEWIEYLDRVFTSALMLKAKMDSHWETNYEFYWPDSRVPIDLGSMEATSGNTKPGQMVMLTLWPGVEEKYLRTGQTRPAARANVWSTANMDKQEGVGASSNDTTSRL